SERRAPDPGQPRHEHHLRPLLRRVDGEQQRRRFPAHQLHAGHHGIGHHERPARGWIVPAVAQHHARRTGAGAPVVALRPDQHTRLHHRHQPAHVHALQRVQPGREQPGNRQRESRRRRGAVSAREGRHDRRQHRLLSEGHRPMRNRMKTVGALGLLAVALACNDKQFLTEQPFDFIGPTNFYRNSGDALAAINGVYADFINSTGDNYYGRNFVMLVEHPTEMWTSRLSATNERMQPDVFAIPVSHSYVQSIWASAYDAINRANSVLDHVPLINMDTTLRGRIVAEAKFLRATHYFNLVRMYGNVPLKLHETAVLDSLNFPQAAPQAVYAQIEQDLKD